MTQPDPELTADPAPGVGASPVSGAGLRSPEAQISMATVAMLAFGALCYFLTPDRGEAMRAGGWWAPVAVVVLGGVAEYTVFNVQFRREGISFALSEIPIAFLLVFLAPLDGIVLRLPLAVGVMLFHRRTSGLKLAFNVGLYVFETAAEILVFRTILRAWGSDGNVALLAGLVVSLIAVAPLASIVISFAVSRYDGRFRERVIAELQATWWMYTINAVLGSMTVSLALVDPPLALLALLPAGGMWYVMRTHAELGQELRNLDAVHGFAGRVGRTLHVPEIAQVAVSEISTMLRADAVSLTLFTDEGVVEHAHGQVPIDLPIDPTAPGWATLVKEAQVQIVDQRRLLELGIRADANVREVLVAPVIDGGGVFALVVATRPTAIRFKYEKADVSRMKNVTEQLAVSLRRGMLHERLEHEARHDALTGLPGRTVFESSVGAAVRTQRSSVVSCVLMLDLDRFKEVNDTLGHHAGDDLLWQFADRMSRLLGPDDVLARLAGDEFAILVHRETIDGVIEFARNCALVGNQPVILDGLEVVVTVSVGVAQILPTDVDAVQPMRRADIAMYNAKWQRSGVEYYRDEIDRRTPARLSMLGDLRAAISAGTLDVVYQPKLELRTGRVVGAEALVRWEHESRGAVAPAEFVRVAEDTGLIKDLTDLVLSRGIATLRRFEDEGCPLGLSINLSTHDLFDARLPDRVRGYLQSNGVPARLLTLEITETSLFVDAPRTRATIDDLNEVGLRLSVDDFGTGYSSLSYLRRLPVRELKIDRSFISTLMTDAQDEVIVRSTIELGHNLGLEVVAEGVETLSTLDRLSDLGCDVAQGYGIAMPMSADDLIAWVRRVETMRATPAAAVHPTAWVAALAAVT